MEKNLEVNSETSQRFKNMAILCSFLVVVIHSVSSFGIQNHFLKFGLYDGFCRIAVPFFFVASGFFLAGHVDEKGWWIDALRKRLRTLVVPYFIWDMLYIIFPLLFAMAYTMIHGHVSADAGSYSLSRFVRDLGLYPLAHPKLQPLWYVRSLLILIVVSPLLVSALKKSQAYKWLGSGCLLVIFLVYGLLGRWEGLHGAVPYFFLYVLWLDCRAISAAWHRQSYAT